MVTAGAETRPRPLRKERALAGLDEASMTHSDTYDPGALIGAVARAAAVRCEDEFMSMLDRIPLAIYRTDRVGTITHYNTACTELAGRTPAVQQDKWCVTWKLFTTEGDFLPHDRCPMAVAIRENRPIRGVRAVAERPNGSHVHFAPYPTPVRNDGGELTGAVNLLADIADPQHQAHCHLLAQKCRWHARSIGDERTRDALMDLATEYGNLAVLALNKD
jgi:PAS domain S-box-containing protein